MSLLLDTQALLWFLLDDPLVEGMPVVSSDNVWLLMVNSHLFWLT